MLFIALLFAALVAGGFVLIVVMVLGRTRLSELAIKERIALIEKGLVPSPETDPERFDSMVGRRRPANPRGARYKTAGVMLMGLGGGMLLLIGFASGAPEVGFGVGGGIAVVGLAALLNGLVLDASE
jgi:hypothetical protein